MTGRIFFSTRLFSPLFSSQINHPVSRITLQECGDHYDVGISKKKNFEEKWIFHIWHLLGSL